MSIAYPLLQQVLRMIKTTQTRQSIPYLNMTKKSEGLRNPIQHFRYFNDGLFRIPVTLNPC